MVDQINHHLYRKRGFYYFSRRVPKALLGDYPKPRIVLALKTRHYRDAIRQSQILSKRLDDQWFHMQLDAMGLDDVQAKVFQPAKAAAPLMSEATVFCLRLKGDGKDLVFTRAAQRNANVVIEALGNRPINEYASSEAGKLRDALLNKGLAVTSIKRMFGSIKAIINMTMAEHGIEGRNPFSSIYMPDEAQEERQPIPLGSLRRIQRDSSYAFPRYCDGKICNANSASAALNKWMKPRLKDNAVVHSFRHSMRDRLRAVECPSDIIDQLGGWS
jgi:uncharacterized protein YcgL (UPF0745 family)